MRFFHTSTVTRRKRNSIVMLKDDRGEWINNEKMIENHIVNHFNSLFNSSSSTVCDTELSNLFAPVISTDENLDLCKEVSENKIISAVKQLGALKAPGPDGLQGIFYTKYWNHVGPSVIDLIKSFFHSGVLDDRLNKTFIALIPKTNNPTTIKEYRPISLCNFSMKIITKIITNRLRPLLNKIVSYNQYAFILGRSLFDTAIMCMRLFILLKPKKVLINGAPSSTFRPSNGLRQGEPLSPCLFIMCLESLTGMINAGIANKSLSGFTVARGAPMVTHSLFADDNIIFLKANYKNALNLKYLIDKFCLWTGQQINKSKSTLLTSANLGRSFTKGMANALGVQVAASPGKYLGIPLQWGRVSEKTYFDIVEKASDLWNANHTKGASVSWRSIMKGRNAVRECLRWNVGDGTSIDFWRDPWVDDLPLANKLQSDEATLPRESVSNFMNSNHHSWDINRLQNSIPENIVNEVIALPVCNLTNNVDTLIWSASKSGITVKDAYVFLNMKFNEDIIVNKDWRKGLCDHPGCNLCNSDFETVFHLFFGCTKVWPIWEKIRSWTGVNLEFEYLSPSFVSKLCCYDISIGRLHWKDVCPFILWSIWIHRNKQVFENVRFNAKCVLASALRSATEYFQANSASSTDGRTMEEIQIAWQVPNTGFYKINTDGSTNDCGDAGIGGVIRDGAGDFVVCFCKHIHKNNNNVAKVWAIRDGLRLANQLGLNLVEVESDSWYAIQLCKGEVKPNLDTYRLVQDISMLKSKFVQLATIGIYIQKNSKRYEITAGMGNSPVGKDAILELDNSGNLVLSDGNIIVWSSNTSDSGVHTAEMSDTGNFVLYNTYLSPVWQSFSHPTNTLLPGQNLTVSLELASSISLPSYGGFYTLKMLQERTSLSLALMYNLPEYFIINTSNLKASSRLHLQLHPETVNSNCISI
ncbi:uncharacterized protein LOC113325863 [Papaver somniferum]|uniref:uncharacterized protein LOC113325863 n=1 Tax=Papaver somniferum TaxID=3469 RepID=UPI000E6F486C|nr:uncharacterized protein LOC113325863 [Papaver somniferum]